MLIAVNAMGGVPVERQAGTLAAALHRLPPDAPITLLTHGFRYSSRTDDPVNGILGADGWPRRLGFGRGQQGLCITFCWDGSGHLWRANARAAQAGRALAGLVRDLRAHHRGPVGVLGHSLGARVALAALPHLGPSDITRMVLLAGAEFRDTAEAALAGKRTEVLNITSRENDGYDLFYENLIAPMSGRRAISTLPSGPRVATVQIDDAAHRAALARLGFPVRPPERRVCHWSCYLRPGLFRLYRRFLMDALPLPTLPEPTPRWSLLWPAGVQRVSVP